MRKWIDILSLAGVAVAAYLVVNEIITSDFCPRFPIIGIPACYLVLGFFILVFITRFINQKRIASSTYFIACLAGMATATWFSANHLIGNLHCPVLLKIPLCIIALPTFIALFIFFLMDSNNIGRR